MRSMALAVLLVLFACDDQPRSAAMCMHDGTTYAVGDTYPVGDGCNSCMCTSSGPVCSSLTCGDAGVAVDANLASCAASGGCPAGPVCGARCCGAGELCMNGTCQCGTKPACGAGDSCEAAGPAGSNSCGSVCCGVSGPCPQ